MEKREQIRTCRHFRFQVPQDLADELRFADSEPCEICDPILFRRGVLLELVKVPEQPGYSPSRN